MKSPNYASQIVRYFLVVTEYPYSNPNTPSSDKQELLTLINLPIYSKGRYLLPFS